MRVGAEGSAATEALALFRVPEVGRGEGSYPSFPSASFYGGKACQAGSGGKGEKGVDRGMEEVRDGERQQGR